MTIFSVKKNNPIKLLLLVFFGLLCFNSTGQNLDNITITITFDTDTAEFSVIKAPLKYNKKFALSMQVSNSSSSVFELGFPVFEGGTIGGNTYDGMTFSDGCSNFNSFKMTSVNYIFQGDPVTGFDIHNDPSSGKVSWHQLDTLVQNQWGVANSGVNTDATEDPSFVNYSISRNISYIRKELYNLTPGGVIPNVFVNPNGNPFWSDYAFDLSSICAFNQSSTIPIGTEGGNVNDTEINWAENRYNLYKKDITSINVKSFVNQLSDLSVDGANYWSSVYTSSLVDNYSFSDFVNDFNYINNTYGSEGSDEILMTTDEEILDYLILRDAVVLNQSIDEDELTLTFSGNIPNDLLYYDISIVLESDANIIDVSIEGTENFSVSEIGDTTALINFSWDGYVVPSAVNLATNYTQTATSTHDVYDAVIAMDYVSTLEYGSTKNDLVNQLCAIPDIPYDEGFCESGFPNFVIITGDSIISFEDDATLTATDYLNNYEWNTGQKTRSITVSPDANTKYWVDAITRYGERVSDTIEVIVSDSYVISHSPFFINDLANEPDSLWVELKESAICQWDNGSNENYIIVNPDITTTYHLDIIVNDTVVNLLDFNVYIGDLIEFTYDSVCLGNTTTLTNISLVNDTITKILWDLNGDTYFDDAEGETVTYTFSEIGIHLVGMKVYFKNEPVNVVYNPVPVGDSPVVDFTFENLCHGSTTLFYDLSTVQTGVVSKWLWQFGDGKTDNFQNTSNYYDEPGIYDVMLTVWSSAGCKDSLQKTIQISEAPTIELKTANDVIVGNNDTIYFAEGGTVTVSISNYSNYDSVVWFDDSYAESVTIAEEGTFNVSAYKNGCYANQRFYTSWGGSPQPSGKNIMNLFTPNGDGINDYWIVNDPDIISPFKVNIYNRSGKQVYANNDYTNTWTGQYDGNPLPQATYYYIIEDGSGVVFKGAVTIIR